MTKWEYVTVPLLVHATKQILDNWGQDGWELVQVIPGSRAAGPARTVVCGQDDNLMVHAAVAEAEPGEVLVLTMPEPRPIALVGELLATQAKGRGVAALLVDAAVRDLE